MPKPATSSSLDDLPKLTIRQYRRTNRTDIRTTSTVCHYGGVRLWFLCKCGRRVGVLYSQDLACRHCVGLSYRTQLKQPIERKIYRANAIRERLGWCAGIANETGTRPKGMHQKTYQRLLAEYDTLCHQITGIYYEKINT